MASDNDPGNRDPALEPDDAASKGSAHSRADARPGRSRIRAMLAPPRIRAALTIMLLAALLALSMSWMVRSLSGQLRSERSDQILRKPAAIATGPAAQDARLFDVRLQTGQDGQNRAESTWWSLLLSALLNLILIGLLAWVIRRSWRRQRATGIELRQQNRELNAAHDEKMRRDRHIQTLSELSHALQSTITLDDAIQLICHYLPRLFDAPAGALFLISDARDEARLACSWGEAPHPAAFTLSECLALRGGEAPPAPGAPERCTHLPAAEAATGSATEARPAAPADASGGADPDWICIPLIGRRGAIALLSLLQPGGDLQALQANPYASSAIEQITLVIGNMKLRENLRQQSIRDPLTGLYNRRYLEEATRREMARAERGLSEGRQAGLAILMLDVDHFKDYNDRHGHEAGDLVLAEVGKLLRRLTRGSDIASRYGGEEFIVVLIDVCTPDALARAEEIRLAVKALQLAYRGTSVDTVTISIGVAVYPSDGETVESLIHAADLALYAAKHAGRNCVRLADEDHSSDQPADQPPTEPPDQPPR